MNKVLLVEDELLVRMALKNSVPWGKYQMTVTGEAANGKEAWEIYEREKPDVVITDLNMPIMGGMELIEKIHATKNDCKIVILSCLEEFDLVRKALAFGVKDYILKLTMTWDEIENILSKVSDELQQQESPKSQVSDRISEESIIKEKMFKGYVFDEIYNSTEFEEYVAKNDLKLLRQNLRVCLMDIDPELIFIEAPSKEHKQVASLSILDAVNAIIRKLPTGEVFYLSDKRYAILINESDEQLKDTLKHIESVTKMYFNIPVAFGVSASSDDYGKIGAMVAEAAHALDYRFFDRGQLILEYSEPVEKDLKGKTIVEISSFISELEELGESSIKEMKQKTKIWFDNQSVTPERVKQLFAMLLRIPLSSLHLQGEEADALLFGYMEKLMKAQSLGSLKETYRDYSSEITSLSKPKFKLSRETVAVVEFVNKHYREKILLQDVAEKVNLSAGYLSILFKKELKQNFSDYLTGVRIEKAKELLKNTYLKSYEVSEQVGFTDYSYFSRVFVKATNMRPNAYREKWSTSSLEGPGDEEI